MKKFRVLLRRRVHIYEEAQTVVDAKDKKEAREKALALEETLYFEEDNASDGTVGAVHAAEIEEIK